MRKVQIFVSREENQWWAEVEAFDNPGTVLFATSFKPTEEKAYQAAKAHCSIMGWELRVVPLSHSNPRLQNKE